MKIRQAIKIARASMQFERYFCSRRPPRWKGSTMSRAMAAAFDVGGRRRPFTPGRKLFYVPRFRKARIVRRGGFIWVKF